MTRPIQLCLVILSVTALVLGETHEMVERMYMSRKSGTDLSPEATGFIFRKDNDGPASYVELGAGVINKHLDKYPSEHYIYPVVPEVFARPPIPLAHAKRVNFHEEQAPKAEKIIVAPIEEESQEDSSESEKENQGSHGIVYDDGTDLDDNYMSKFDGYKGRDLSDIDDFTGYGEDTGFDAHGYSGFEGHGHGRGFGSHHDFDDHNFGGHSGFNGNSGHNGGKYSYGIHHGVGDDFSYGGGMSYNGDEFSEHGGKESKGYKGHHSFDNGEADQNGAEGHEAHYNKGASEKGAKYDENDEYGTHNSAGEGYKGEHSGEKKGHSKGEKTTGFHNVYHKDEYKKDKEVFDESDARGHFNKHGSEGAHHDAAHGGHKKGGEHESAENHDSFGKEGSNEAGHKYSTDRGHDGKSGADSYHNYHTDFANKRGSRAERAYDSKH